MTPEYFEKEVLLKTFEEIIEISRTKGHEYTQGEDRLKNFRTTGEAIGLDPLKTLYIFMRKHWDSITTYVKENGKIYSNESIEGRLNDLILYAVLMKAIIADSIKEE